MKRQLVVIAGPAAGRVSEVRETADVYSLGAILYATLTGRPPFQADNPLDTLMQVLEREPLSPRALNSAVPLDLETICLKCLSKDRRHRYPSAAELGDELQRYLEGRPIHSRPISRSARAWRWCKRNPVVATLTAAVLVSLVAGTVVSTMFAIEARERAIGEAEQRHAAELQTGIAQKQLTRAEWLLYANAISAAQREGELNNPTRAIGHLDRTPSERRGWEFYYLRSQNTQSKRLSIAAHDQKVLTLARSADGRLIASSGRDRKVALWDAASGRALSPLSCDHFVNHLSFSSDATLLAGVATSGRLFLWETATGHLRRETVTNPVSALGAATAAFLPGGNSIVTNNKDGTLRIWDTTSGDELRSISLPAAAVVIAVSPDGCNQQSAPETAAPATGNATSAPTTSAAAKQNAAEPDVVATILGRPVKRSDCVGRSAGIGSPEIGIYSLVLQMLMQDFRQSQNLTVSPAEIDAFWSLLRERTRQTNPDVPQPSVPEPAFDEASVQAKLQEVLGKLAAAEVPLLEKLALQSQVEGLQQAHELKSQAAMIAYGQLMPLRIEAALCKKYGGKVVARQISIHASGAYLKLAEEAQASGKLVFHDEALKQAFWKRLNDDLKNTEVPPERVDFSLPLLMQGPAPIHPRTPANATTTSTPPEAPTFDKEGQP